MSGWIKLKRSIFEHWVSSDSEYLSVWVRMLSEANFESKTKMFNGSLVTVNRGQIVFGLQAWSDKTGVQISKLRRLILLLENDSMISRQVFNKYSIISITNYELHQDDDRQDAGEPQANDRQPATPKERKKERNISLKSIGSELDFSAWPQQPSADILAAWLKRRKEVKATNSQLAMNTIGKELHKAVQMGFSVDYCLCEAESSGWKGFKADWLQRQVATYAGHQNNSAAARLEQWRSETHARLVEQVGEDSGKCDW